MEHALDDCRLKIARAKEQFDGLHDEMRDFIENHPYVVEMKIDPKSRDEFLRSADPPVFPPRWGVLVGELLHNLRSALDYLIGEFVREAGREPNGNAFPISKTESRYLRRNKRGVSYRDRCLRGVPEPLRKRIDGFQPYKRGKLAHADMLLALADFTNRDKHRTPIAAYAWINTPTRVVTIPTGAKVRNLQIHVPSEGGITVDAEFKGGKRRNLPAIAVALDVKVPRSPGVEVVFGREIGKLIALDDLRQLIFYVESIVESFAGDFKP